MTPSHEMPLAIEGRLKPGVAQLWQQFYPDYDANIISSLVLEHVHPESRVLEIGCGDGRNSPPLKGRVAYSAGIDPDERVLSNPNLDAAVVGDASVLDWPDQSFDLVFHRMVAEHLPDPVAAMRETARVLKPGGVLLFETPNRWYYPMVVASVTPHWFHTFWVSRLGSGRASEDVFPTVYRLNTRGAIAKTCAAAGLTAETRLVRTPPGYLRFSRPSFLLGVLYERTVERIFPALRGRLVVEATRPAGTFA